MLSNLQKLLYSNNVVEETKQEYDEQSAVEMVDCSFNQTSTCIAVAHSTGFSIFQCKPFTKAFECSTVSARRVAMLFATSLVALLGNSSSAVLAKGQIASSLRAVKLLSPIPVVQFGGRC